MRALDGGVDTMLVLVTRMPGFRRREFGAVFRAAAGVVMAGQSKAVRHTISGEDSRFNAAMEILERPREQPPGVTVWPVFPSDARRLVGRTTADRERLRSCAEMGRHDMQRLLDATAAAAP